MADVGGIAGEQLRSFIERIERLRAEAKALGEDIKAVKQEAKGSGFDVPIMMRVVKIREMKPHDYQEEKVIEELYLSALGMLVEPPLFRAAGLAAHDPSVRENVLAGMRLFVPAFGKGDIVVTWGGKRIRLTRDADDKVIEQEIVESAPKASTTAARPAAQRQAPSADVPDVDDAGARDLGKRYGQENRPVIDNPFPFGDSRRRHFDEGWRAGANSDGMGPEEE